MIKVLLVDDHAIVREGLKRILHEAKGIEVAGEAENGVEALKMMRKEKWDIVLLDISMPEKNGIDTLKQIMSVNKNSKILMLSVYPEDQHAVRLIKAGASGYLTKDAAPEQLVDAIRKVVAGRKYISSTLAELLLLESDNDSGRPLHTNLSDREYQVMRMIGSGKTVSAIARALSLSPKTVSTYRANVLEKMNLKNSAELTQYVIQHGLAEY